MCALLQRAFPLPTSLRRAKNFAPPSFFQIDAFWNVRLLLWKKWTRLEIRNSSKFLILKIWIFQGGARLSPFSWVDRFWIIILSKVHLWGPQNSAKINFVAHWIFIQGRWILDKLIYLKEGQILGLDFPKFVQIFASVWGFIFRVCFIRKVNWETILKGTYR